MIACLVEDYGQGTCALYRWDNHQIAGCLDLILHTCESVMVYLPRGQAWTCASTLGLQPPFQANRYQG